MASRRAFLADATHRVRFVFLPKHSSWLNQIETVFGIVMRKVIRRGNFTSVADLTDKLRRFLDYFNRVFAHPFRWTYTGKPLTNVPSVRYCPPHRRLSLSVPLDVKTAA
ncbi:MAG: transposase [Thermoanaerobaculia bacterium]